MAIGGFHVEPVAIHAEASIADGAAGAGRVTIVPDLTAGTRVNGPRVVGGGEVEDAVDHQRRGFDGDGCGATASPSGSAASTGCVGTSSEARHPEYREVVDVGRIDLLERTEAAGGVIAV